MKGKADALGKPVDLSKIDGMTCIRMRVTGHSREVIQAAAEAMAPELREALGDTGTHIWPDYAARTARYAFSARGDRAIAESTHYHKYWHKVEKRAEPVRARPPRRGTLSARPDGAWCSLSVC